MDTRNWILRAGLSGLLALAGCGSDGNGATDGGSTGGKDGGSNTGGKDGGGNTGGKDGGSDTGGKDGGGNTGGKDSGTTGGEPGGACEKDADCADDIDCTSETCQDGTCVIVVDDSACEAGESCDLPAGGCVRGDDCDGPTDCTFPFCSQNGTCDADEKVCTFDARDEDEDGQSPTDCGGGDCDDTNADVGVGMTETCNGIDDDCDGKADNGSICDNGQICLEAGTEDATCGCAETDDMCGGQCVNTQTDPENCGDCRGQGGDNCGTGGVCADGDCECPNSATECGPDCADTSIDEEHCGDCDTECTVGDMGQFTGLCLDSSCADCGGEDEPCCDSAPDFSFGSGCGGGMECEGERGSATSKCVVPPACGSDGEMCCEDNGGFQGTCGITGICEGTPGASDSECHECGSTGNPCCSFGCLGGGGGGGGASVCEGTPGELDSECVTCGAEGDPCCQTGGGGGDGCSGPLNCNSSDVCEAAP